MNQKKQFPVPIAIYEWLTEELSHLSGREYRFVVRLIDTTIYSLSQDKGPYVYIKSEKYRGIDLEKLGWVTYYDKKAADKSDEHPDFFLKERTKNRNHALFKAEHYIVSKKSRKFMVLWWFWDKYFIKLKDELTKDEVPEIVSLYNGKPINKKTLYDKDLEHPQADKPEIRKAIRNIKERPFNKAAVLKHLRSIELDSSSYKRYATDFHTWIGIQLKGLKEIDPKKGIFSYKPIYKIQAAGRISEVGYGFQSSSRDMKRASIKGLKGVYNYDLRGSQINGLIHQFRLFGFETAWLENYVNNPKAKEQHAQKNGVSVDAWKQCLLMIVMGSSINRAIPRGGKSKKMDPTALYKCIEKDLEKKNSKSPKEVEVEKVRLSILEDLEELRDPLNKWRWRVKNQYAEILGSEYGRKYGETILIKNKLGITYDTEKYTTAQLAARILQGQESAFIHKLTNLSGKYKFTVIGNEHDGLITEGEIPDKAVEEVKVELDIKEFMLEEKPDF